MTEAEYKALKEKDLADAQALVDKLQFYLENHFFCNIFATR